MSQICQSCGNPLGEGPFCSGCGAPVKAPKAKKECKLPSKKVLIPAAAVVLAVIVLLLVIPALSSGGYSSRLYPIYSLDDEATYFAYGTKLLKDSFDGDYRYSKASMDYSVEVYLSAEDELWAVSRKGIVELGDEVSNFQVSADGSTVAYFNEDRELYLGSTKTGKCEEIAEDVGRMVLSPNGKTVLYVTYDDGEAILWLHGKKPVELGEDLTPVAVSNGGKYMYCVDEKGNLVLVNKKGDTEKICADVDESTLLLNRDLSQVLFSAKGKWYISVRGGEKQKLDMDTNNLHMVTGRWSKTGYYDYATVHDVKSLGGNFYYGGNGSMMSVFYLKNNLQAETCTKKAASPINLSDDGKRVYFLSDNQKLKYATASRPGDAVEVAKHVVGYVLTDGGKSVYYRDEDNVLLCQKGKKTVEIEEDVYGLYKTHNDKIIFLAEKDRNGNGTLYTVKGDKAEEISEDVKTVALRPGVTYYLEQTDDGEYDVYAAKGVKFEKIMEEAGW